MKKVKNVIKGYLSKFDITEVTFFKNDEVEYSGSYESFKEMNCDKSEYLGKVKSDILESDCIKCINFNDTKLFIFIN